MYSQNFAVAIKVNGKVLRETGDTVSIPLQSEFAVFVKNLNSVRAMVGVSIDGKDVADGEKLVIEPNSSVEIERYIRGKNVKNGNRFKFIERTAGIEDHRGIGAEDGLVRIEAFKEKVTQFVDVPITRYNYYDQWVPVPRPTWPMYPRPYWWGATDGTLVQSQSVGEATCNNVSSASCSIGSETVKSTSHTPKRSGGIRGSSLRSFCPVETEVERANYAGITVAGSLSDQQFRYVAGFPLETTSSVIVLRLRGEVGGKPVVAPVTVKAKITCATCGKTNKANGKFCGNCGTALELF